MNATKWYPTCRQSKAPAGGCAAICAWCRPHKESRRCVYKTPYLCAPKLCRDAGNRTRILRTRSVCNTTIPHPDTVFERINDTSTKQNRCTLQELNLRPLQCECSALTS